MGDIEAEVDRLIDERGGREMLLPVNDAEAVEITPFIFKSTGSTAAYVAGDAERLIVDTGKGAEAPHHNRLFDAVAPLPTRYIVTTQAHVDHVGGVSRFREPGTTYVAQENNATCQADDRRIAGFRSREARPWFKKNYARQAAEAMIRKYLTENPRGQDGKVVYDLRRDFGIVPDELRRRFDDYLGRFRVVAETP